jgi:alcohol dehydrogenase (cytochrome c)
VTRRAGWRALAVCVAAFVSPACSRLRPWPSDSGTRAKSVAPGDWPSFNRTLAGDRFSPLAEINRSNVARLQTLCTYELPEVAALQTGPVVVGGIMYFTSDTISYAIDASTCAERWRSVRHSPTPSRLGVNRGLAYLDGRLFRGTSDAHVIGLDASDGHVAWDVRLDVAGRGVTVPMAPIAWNGLVFVGNAGGDLSGVVGHVYALDARDGHVVWKFDVVPSQGPARSSWPTADQAGVLYVAAGNPAPDFDVAVRDGDNLYSNSLIALDAPTGQMVGYTQLVKHDFHDWDVDSPAALVTTRAGRAIAASANKDGLLSVVDRRGVTAAGAAATPIELAGTLPLIFQVPTTTRKNVAVPLSRDHKTRFCPGMQGGSEWNGAAYHPGLNALYVGSVDWCATVQLAPASAPVPAVGISWFGAAAQSMDPPANARGWLTAFDADDGAVRWKFAAAHPVLAGVTPTAGELLFAADMAGTLYAFDAGSGQVLWQTTTGQSMGGGIVSYVAGGRQLIGVAAGMKSPIWPGGSAASHIFVYGLH